MARNMEIVTAQGAGWVELTNDDVTAITFQVVSGVAEIRRGTSASPDITLRGMVFSFSEGFLQRDLSTIAYGSGARIWAKAHAGRFAQVLVDHE